MQHRQTFVDYLKASPLLPAPMCNYTDRPFRDLLRLMGAHLVYTEMYSSEAMTRGDPKTMRLMDYRGERAPLAVQIFGRRPDLMAESVRIVERWGAEVIDLNLGCPVKKITKAGCGAAMGQDHSSAMRVIRAMRRATDLPFTIKMRWQPDGGSLKLARMARDEGVDAVALHARTWEQAYAGQADWDCIARLKEAVSIPVIGNGDVRTVADARRMRRLTGCDGVMVGRGMMGNPWLMARAAAAELHREKPGETPDEGPEGRDTEEALPELEERLPILFAHARLMQRHRGERGLVEFRKHCVAYIKGLPGARAARPELMQVTTLEELEEILRKHFGDFEQIDISPFME
ncbi:MAG: tRNA dihydrouridine synthase DusB [Candidatus Sumerlaeota bacterium]